MVLTDRTTGLAVELIISDGVYGVAESTDTPTTEPVLSDAISGNNYTVFVDDGVVGWEVTEDGATASSITIVDQTTAISWLLKVVDGVLSYMYAFTLTTARNSKVTTTITGSSAHGASINKSSKSAVTISRESKVN